MVGYSQHLNTLKPCLDISFSTGDKCDVPLDIFVWINIVTFFYHNTLHLCIQRWLGYDPSMYNSDDPVPDAVARYGHCLYRSYIMLTLSLFHPIFSLCRYRGFRSVLEFHAMHCWSGACLRGKDVSTDCTRALPRSG